MKIQWVVLAAALTVLVAYLVNQLPPLKGPISAAAKALSKRTKIGPGFCLASIYVVLVAVAVGATLGVSALASPSTDAAQPPVSPSSSTSTLPVRGGGGSITVEPKQGPAGTSVYIAAKGFAAGEAVRIEIFNGAGIKDFQGPYQLTDVQANVHGEISTEGTIPSELCCPKGSVLVRATGRSSKTTAESRFTLT